MRYTVLHGQGGSEDLYNGAESPAARKKCPKDLWSVAREKLKHERKGQMSIRINQRHRMCFRWENGDAYEIEIVDYHESKKAPVYTDAGRNYHENKAT
jgi:Txe/YoeB family toxin of Txe-Axe toxin-antitoxin module